MKIQFSLQLKLAFMFFAVMLVSAAASIITLLLICRPLLIENNQTKIKSVAGSMKQLELITNFDTSTITSIIPAESAEVSTITNEDAEYYKVKIDAAEQNCFIDIDHSLMPDVIGYTTIRGEYVKINPNWKDSVYTVTLLVVILTMIVCIALGSLLTVFVSNRIVKPIKELNIATNLVARGNFKVRVPQSKDKEYQQLINNFNRMAEELSGIETLRGDFISNVSHEFKTPLASIQGFAKLLQDDTLSEDERREYTQIIISETSRLSKLTSDILRLSKLENQNTIPNKRRFSIDEQIRKILLVLEPEWTKKNIELDISLDTVYYYGNEELMAQIWQNIINNAIKFTPENGHIGVKLFTNEKNITAKITDDGPSIPPAVAAKIFDKFYQGDNSRKTEGNGLGLALVKRIVDLCDGRLGVSNIPEGGVCFSVELPYVIADMM